MSKDREDLAAFVFHGDQHAFERLAERYWGLIWATCKRSGAEDPDDAAQAVFLVLATQARRLLKRANLAGFLYETARRVSWQQRRSAAARKQREQATATPGAYIMPDPDLLDAIHTALDRLNGADKAAILLRHVQGLSEAEVAERLGVSVSAATSRLSRARSKLRRLLSSPSFSGFEAGALSVSAIALTTPPLSALGSDAIAILRGSNPGNTAAVLANQTLKTTIWVSRIKPLLFSGAAVLAASLVIAAVSHQMHSDQGRHHHQAREGGLGLHDPVILADDLKASVRLPLRRDYPLEIVERLSNALPRSNRLRFSFPGCLDITSTVPPFTSTIIASKAMPLHEWLDCLAAEHGWQWRLYSETVVMSQSLDEEFRKTLRGDIRRAVDEANRKGKDTLQALPPHLWSEYAASLDHPDFWRIFIPEILQRTSTDGLKNMYRDDILGTGIWRFSWHNGRMLPFNPDADRWRRGSPIRALANDDHVCKVVVESLRKPKSDRHQALAALLAGEMGLHEPLPDLVALARAPDEQRYWAIAALGSLASPEATPVLLDAWAKRAALDEREVTLICDALGLLGDPVAADALASGIVTALEAPNKSAAASIFENDEPGVPRWWHAALRAWALCADAKDPFLTSLSGRVEQTALPALVRASMLHQSPVPSFLTTPLDRPTIDPDDPLTGQLLRSLPQDRLLKILESGQLRSVSKSATETLVGLWSWNPSVPPVRPTSALHLRLLGQTRTAFAVHQLGGLIEPAAPAGLYRACIESNVPSLENAIIASLSQADLGHLREAIAGLSMNRNPQISVQLLRNLMSREPDESMTRLLANWPQADNPVVVDALQSLIQDTGNPLHLRGAAIYALIHSNHPNADQVLLHLVDDPNGSPYLRACVVHAAGLRDFDFGRTGKNLLHNVAKRCIGDPDPQVRQYAVARLAWDSIAGADIKRVMTMAETDSSMRVRSTAAFVLRMIEKDFREPAKEQGIVPMWPRFTHEERSQFRNRMAQIRASQSSSAIAAILQTPLPELIKGSPHQVGAPTPALPSFSIGVVQYGGTEIAVQNNGNGDADGDSEQCADDRPLMEMFLLPPTIDQNMDEVGLPIANG